MKKPFLLPIFLCLCSFLFGQQPEFTFLHPYKEDGSFGLVDVRTGEIICAPTYDRVLPGTNEGFPVEKNGGTGWINLDGTEAIPPKYKNVKALRGNRYAVEQEEGGYVVMDISGKQLLTETYEEIARHPFLDDVLFIKKNGKWGFTSFRNQFTSEHKYFKLDELRGSRDFITFKVEKGGKDGMLSLQNGKEIIPPEYKLITAINDEFTAVAPENIYGLIRHSDGKLILETEWKRITKLSRHYLKLIGNEFGSHIFRLRDGKIIEIEGNYNDFLPFNKEYFLAQGLDGVDLINHAGNSVFNEQYDFIGTYKGEHIVKVSKDQLFGLRDALNNTELLPINFKSLPENEHEFIEVVNENGRGLYNNKYKEIVPPKFSILQVGKNSIKAKRGKEATVYYLNENNEVERSETFGKVFTLKIGYSKSATIGEKRSVTPDNFNLVTLPEPLYEWVKSPKKKKNVGLIKIGTDSLLTPYSYRNKSPENTHLSYVKTPRFMLRGEFLKTITGANADLKYHPFLIYDMTIGKCMHDREQMYCGVNHFDLFKGVSFLRAVRADGTFELMLPQGGNINDKDGNPILASYVGELKNGRIRFAVGGEWSKESEQKLPFVITRKTFMETYHMTEHGEYMDDTVIKLYLNNAKWGYLNAEGEIIIEPTYDFVEDYFEDRAVCILNKKSGVIDPQGEEVIPFLYDKISYSKRNQLFELKNSNKGTQYLMDNEGNLLSDIAFNGISEIKDGIRRVELNGKYGYVDTLGNLIAECNFDTASLFNEGYAFVEKDSVSYLLSKDGKLLESFPLDARGAPSDGLVLIRKNGKYGYSDIQGNIKIKPAFSLAFDFKHGVARVVAAGKTGLIDKSGNFVLVPEKYELIFPFQDNGLAIVQYVQFEKMGLIDKDGKTILEPSYDHIYEFENGYAVIKNEKRFGLVSEAGQEILPPVNNTLYKPSEGKIAVQRYMSQPWQFLDMEGKPVFDSLKFDTPSYFKDGTAIIGQKDTTGRIYRSLIDSDGNTILSTHPDRTLVFRSGDILGIRERKYYGFMNGKHYDRYHFKKMGEDNYMSPERGFDRLLPFNNGTAVVKRDAGGYALMDAKGRNYTQAKFSKIQRNDDGTYLGTPQTFIGLADQNGNVILEPVYDFYKVVTRTGNGAIRVEEGDKIGYINLFGEWIHEASN